MQTKLTASEKETILGNNGLQRYLRSLETGREATPHSWLFEGESSDVTLERWMSRLSVLESQGSNFEGEVFQFDTSQLKKWGPQGAVPPIADLEDVYAQGYAEAPQPLAFVSREWIDAREAVIKTFLINGIHSLRPRAYCHVIDDMAARDTLESNSGWPSFARRSKPEVKTKSIADAKSGAWRHYPAIALFRNYNQKTRLVWMFPMSTNLVEAAFAQPLQKAIRAVPHLAEVFFAPWNGFEAVRRLIDNVIAEEGDCVYASDFSATDAHFTKYATNEVSIVLQRLFRPEFREDLHDSLMHMHQIPLVLGEDLKLEGWHGVSSGSNWTNFVETVFDFIFTTYVVNIQKTRERKVYGNLKIFDGLCAIGDDIAWTSIKWNSEAASIIAQCAANVGQSTNEEKVSSSPDKVKFLQRLFQRGYSRSDGLIRAVYPTIRALNASLHPERFHDPRKWSKDMFAVRQFMILENCVDHPLFEEFVKFVCAGHPYLVTFAKLDGNALNRAHRESKLLPGLNSTYNQERRNSKLSQFASVKLARKLG